MDSIVMGPLVYGLCALASFACAIVLWRSYRRRAERLIFLTGLCFAGLTVHNLLLFVDLVMAPALDLGTVRSAVGLASMAMLLFALIWEAS
jgi:hypothetical protein